jgi:hypothetical protein
MNEAGCKLSEQIQRFFSNKIKFMMYNFQGLLWMPTNLNKENPQIFQHTEFQKVYFQKFWPKVS